MVNGALFLIFSLSSSCSYKISCVWNASTTKSTEGGRRDTMRVNLHVLPKNTMVVARLEPRLLDP